MFIPSITRTSVLDKASRVYILQNYGQKKIGYTAGVLNRLFMNQIVPCSNLCTDVLMYRSDEVSKNHFCQFFFFFAIGMIEMHNNFSPNFWPLQFTCKQALIIGSMSNVCLSHLHVCSTSIDFAPPTTHQTLLAGHMYASPVNYNLS